MASRSALSGLTRRSRLAWRFSASISVSGLSMADKRSSSQSGLPRTRARQRGRIDARHALQPFGLGRVQPFGQFLRAQRGGQAQDGQTARGRANAAFTVLAVAPQMPQHVVDGFGDFGAVAGAQAGMAAQPVRQGRVRRIGPLQDLAQHALHLVDANGGIGLAWARRLRCAACPPRGPPWPDVGRESWPGRPSRRSAPGRPSRSPRKSRSSRPPSKRGLGDSGRSARPDRRAGRGVHRPDRHGPARDARRNGHRGDRPGRIPGALRTTVAAVVVVFTTAILLAIVTARLPAAVLASAAGIFPARILTIIAGVFPASFLAARSRSLATAGIALPLIATISARPSRPPPCSRRSWPACSRWPSCSRRPSWRSSRPYSRRLAPARRPAAPPARHGARGSAWPPRPPSGPEARAGRSERSTVARASPFGREKKDRPSRPSPALAAAGRERGDWGLLMVYSK